MKGIKTPKRIIWEQERIRLVVTTDSFNVEVKAKDGLTWSTDGYYTTIDQALKGLWNTSIQLGLLFTNDEPRLVYANALNSVREIIGAFIPAELKEHHNINTPKEDQILKSEATKGNIGNISNDCRETGRGP